MVVMNRVRLRINRRRRNTIIIIVIIAVLAAFLVPYWTEPGIPVFMYHCVADEPRGGDENLYCRPAQIEEQFKYLSDNNKCDKPSDCHLWCINRSHLIFQK